MTDATHTRVRTSVPPNLSTLLHQSSHSIRIVAHPFRPQCWQRSLCSSSLTPVSGPWAYARSRTGKDADRRHAPQLAPVIDSAVDFQIDGSAMTEMHRDRETDCREEVCGEAQR